MLLPLSSGCAGEAIVGTVLFLVILFFFFLVIHPIPLFSLFGIFERADRHALLTAMHFILLRGSSSSIRSGARITNEPSEAPFALHHGPVDVAPQSAQSVRQLRPDVDLTRVIASIVLAHVEFHAAHKFFFFLMIASTIIVMTRAIGRASRAATSGRGRGASAARTCLTVVRRIGHVDGGIARGIGRVRGALVKSEFRRRS
mmetsp:Transcript_34390/g.72460  ORF Transcript_34390/g.72460 Transcript_34390/m.72460 type:complete len:201 (-) Transcript_34390:873-1475(-)